MSTGALKYGDRAAREVSARILGAFADEATLVAIPADAVVDGAIAVTLDGAKLWVYNASSSTTPSATVLALTNVAGRLIHIEAAPQA
jgi:hypothetical protein